MSPTNPCNVLLPFAGFSLTLAKCSLKFRSVQSGLVAEVVPLGQLFYFWGFYFRHWESWLTVMTRRRVHVTWEISKWRTLYRRLTTADLTSGTQNCSQMGSNWTGFKSKCSSYYPVPSAYFPMFVSRMNNNPLIINKKTASYLFNQCLAGIIRVV